MFHPPPPPEPTPRPPNPHVTDEPAGPDVPIAEMRAYVADCLDHGSQIADIRTQLIALGYSAAEATRLIQSVETQHRLRGDGVYVDEVKAAGKRNMLIGGGICLLGIIVTCGSLAASANTGGGGIIAYGAIIWGFIQFCRGAAQATGGRTR